MPILSASPCFLMFTISSDPGFSVADCKKNDGLGRIRTGDLRRVKTEDLGLFEAFAVGETTTRKANAPS